MSGAREERAVTSRVFGYLSSGEAVTEFTLTNPGGMMVKVLDYGGIITEVHVPDRDGHLANVVLGFDALSHYEQHDAYFGAIVGRCAGRIANAAFSLDGVDVHLARNHGRHHLHGGVRGFDRAIWAADIDKTTRQLTLRYRSQDGEEGYPGTLDVQVTYALSDDDELRVDYAATTDSRTVLNPTQHTYFNLSGDLGSKILDHRLRVDADEILELGESCIPTGKRLPVAGSPFDFRHSKPIGQAIDEDDPQLAIGDGYDHYWVLSKVAHSETPAHAATLEDPQSGRRLEVFTTEPGVQIYTGNNLDGTPTGKARQSYQRRTAICLETQHPPDAPNHSAFPSTVLEPGEPFSSTTVFRFQPPSTTR